MGESMQEPVDQINANDYHSSMNQDENSDTPARPSQPRGEEGLPTRVQSSELLGPSGQIEIEHAGRIYRLRVTQQGKLILTA